MAGRKQKVPDPRSMSKRQLRRKKPIDSSYMVEIQPLTENQELFFKEWGE